MTDGKQHNLFYGGRRSRVTQVEDPYDPFVGEVKVHANQPTVPVPLSLQAILTKEEESRNSIGPVATCLMKIFELGQQQGAEDAINNIAQNMRKMAEPDEGPFVTYDCYDPYAAKRR